MKAFTLATPAASNTAAASTNWERNLLFMAKLLELLAGGARTGALAASLRLMVHVSVLRFRPFPGPQGTVIALPAYL